MADPAYKVEPSIEHPGCEHCGAGCYWDVIAPDGVALGRSFIDEETASDYADDLTRAFELGRSIPHRAEAPVGALQGTLPLVLYFANAEERDELIAAVEARPSMRAVKI